MKNIILNKLAFALILVVFAFASAQVKLDVKFVGETYADQLGGVKPNDDQVTNGNNGSGGTSFFQGGAYVDDMDLSFTATIDNVKAGILIDEINDGETPIGFDSAYLEVNDLFDGLLSLRFFDIGYSKGKNNIIRPDIGANGIKVTVKPIDLLTVSLGYGIKETHLYLNHVGTTNSPPGIERFADRRLHSIQADVGINNAFVPATVHFGTLIVDGQNTGLNIQKSVSSASSVSATNVNEKIYHMSVGATADLLAFLKADALKLDLSVVLPFASGRVIDADKTSGDYDKELNFGAALHGSVADLGVEGLGLTYYAHFILDTTTKAANFDDLDYDSDDADGMIKAELEPSFAIGQFKFDVKGQFIYVGKKEAQSRLYGNTTFGSIDTIDAVKTAKFDKAFSSFYAEPEVHWTPAEGMKVSAFFRFYNNNMEIENNAKMRLGMRYSLAFGIEGI